MINASELLPGVIQVTITTAGYGLTGLHWQRVLGTANHNGYGKVYIQRFGANRRRYEACYDLRGYYKGLPSVDIDECPGAMFIWSGPKFEAHTEPVDAFSNRALGSDLSRALSAYPQSSETDLWEVRFRFI